MQPDKLKELKQGDLINVTIKAGLLFPAILTYFNDFDKRVIFDRFKNNCLHGLSVGEGYIIFPIKYIEKVEQENSDLTHNEMRFIIQEAKELNMGETINKYIQLS